MPSQSVDGRSRELCGRRAGVDAEDLVGIALLALVAKPPNPKTPAQLQRWLRTVLRNQNARRLRDLHGGEFPVSLDVLTGWRGD